MQYIDMEPIKKASAKHHNPKTDNALRSASRLIISRFADKKAFDRHAKLHFDIQPSEGGKRQFAVAGRTDWEDKTLKQVRKLLLTHGLAGTVEERVLRAYGLASLLFEGMELKKQLDKKHPAKIMQR